MPHLVVAGEGLVARVGLAAVVEAEGVVGAAGRAGVEARAGTGEAMEGGCSCSTSRNPHTTCVYTKSRLTRRTCSWLRRWDHLHSLPAGRGGRVVEVRVERSVAGTYAVQRVHVQLREPLTVEWTAMPSKSFHVRGEGQASHNDHHR